MTTFDTALAERPEKTKTAYTLENHFLIAMPHLNDGYFNNTVIYLWKHDPEGALGIVVNKPSRMRVTELLHDVQVQAKNADIHKVLHRERVLTGGPVETHKGFILHESGREWDYTLPLTDRISLTMSRDILADIAAQRGPERYLIALGCAGWEAGQLEQEITNNVWLTVPADPELLFSHDYETKPEMAAAVLGVSLNQLWSRAGHS